MGLCLDRNFIMATSGRTSRERVEYAAAALTKACDDVESGRYPHSIITPLEMELRKARADLDVYVR